MRIVSVPAHFAGSYFRKLSFHPDGGRPQAGDVLLESNSNLQRGRDMKLYSSVLRNSLFLFAVILALPPVRAIAQPNQESLASAAQMATVPARLTQAIDDTQLVRLQGNVHPLARPEFDQGAVADSTPMNRMLLLLQRGPDQEAALRQLMDEQQSKDSPNFHQWLTPDQFGKQFGPADADVQAITDWLTRQGFRGIKVAAGRTVSFPETSAGCAMRSTRTSTNFLSGASGDKRTSAIRRFRLHWRQSSQALFPCTIFRGNRCYIVPVRSRAPPMAASYPSSPQAAASI